MVECQSKKRSFCWSSQHTSNWEEIPWWTQGTPQGCSPHLFSKGPPRQWHIEELKIRRERTGGISEHLWMRTRDICSSSDGKPSNLHMCSLLISWFTSADFQMEPLNYDVVEPTTNWQCGGLSFHRKLSIKKKKKGDVSMKSQKCISLSTICIFNHIITDNMDTSTKCNYSHPDWWYDPDYGRQFH